MENGRPPGAAQTNTGERPRLLLTLEPLPGSGPVSDWPRIRRACKALLRSLGLRMVEMIRDAPRDSPPGTPPG